MKKIFMLAISIGMAFMGYSQTYINEDFSTFLNDTLPPLSSGWKNVDSAGTGQTWRFNDNRNRITGAQNSLIDSDYAIIDSDDYGSGNNQDAYLQSPNFNASAATAVVLEFDHAHIPAGDSAYVQVFDGISWIQVASFGAISHGFSGNFTPVHETINLTSTLAGVANAQIRFQYNNNGSWAWYWILDNVTVYQPIPDDLKAIAVDSLVNGCGLTATETVALRFTNVGSTPVSNIPVQYSLNGGAVISEFYAPTVLPGDTVIHSFAAKANMSVPGNYIVRANTNLRGDANPVNDSAVGLAVHKPLVNTFPYFQDFESGNAGWLSAGNSNTWALGTPTGSVINTAGSGTNSWVTNLTGNYNNNEESFVEAPCFDFSSLSAPQIKMSVWWNSEFSWDGAALQSSVDNGLTWQNVGAFLDPNNWYTDNSINGLTNLANPQDGWSGRTSSANGSGGWVLAEHDLASLAGVSGVNLRIVFGSDGSVQDEGFAFDDVLIQDAPASDAGVVGISSPGNSCGFGAADTLKILISNYGSANLTAVPVGYILNNGTAVNETYNGLILPGDTVEYSFTTVVNFSTPGIYNFDIYTALVGDGNFLNDSLFNLDVRNTLKSFPYSTDFDNVPSGQTGVMNNDWTTESAAGNIEWFSNTGATSSFGTGPSGDHTSGSGVYAYTEVNFNASFGEEASLISPCIDLTTNPTGIAIDFWYHMFGNDVQTLYVDIDSAGFWLTVDSIVGQQQTSNAAAFNFGSVTLSNNLSGLSDFRVRFRTFSGNGTASDVAIDDVRIYTPSNIDAGVVEIVTPTDGCGLGSADTVRVRIRNFGLATITTVPVNYSINGATATTNTYTGSILPGDTADFTFTTTANVSTPGNYSIIAYSTLAGDGDVTNDSADKVFTHIPILTTYPYTEGFESGNGGWTSGGNSSTWALGTPAGATITGAATGTQAWTTNLAGQYNNNESSFVQGPCFDFTNLAAPQIKMNIWWNSESGWDGANLQTSVDGGNSWQNVGAFGNPNNWYNNASINGTPGGSSEGWSGRASSANGSGSWVLAEHDLNGLGGVSGVLIRVAFGSDGSVTDDGFAFDDVVIQDAPASDVGMIGFLTPTNGGCSASTADSVRVVISNFGSAPSVNFPVSFVFNGGTAVTETVSDTLFPGDTATHTFNTTVNVGTQGSSYTFDGYTALIGDGNLLNDSILGYTVTNNASFGTYPYFENFDALAPQASGSFTNGWTGTANGTFQWFSNTGATNSTATGPTGDHTSGSGIYMYTESSSGANGNSAELTSPCIDLATHTGSVLTLSYWYHMYGANIQTLFVEVDSMGTWVTVDAITGQQQVANADPFLFRMASLDNFVSLPFIKLRFRTAYGGSFNGDVSIDDVAINANTVGIENIDVVSNEFSLFPNPSNGVFTLSLSEELNQVNVEIRNINGKLISEELINNTSNAKQFDLSNLAKGVYFVKAFNNEFSKTEKLIIK